MSEKRVVPVSLLPAAGLALARTITLAGDATYPAAANNYTGVLSALWSGCG